MRNFLIYIFHWNFDKTFGLNALEIPLVVINEINREMFVQLLNNAYEKYFQEEGTMTNEMFLNNVCNVDTLASIWMNLHRITASPRNFPQFKF